MSARTRRGAWLLATGLGLIPWLVYIAATPIAVDAWAYFHADYGVIGEPGAYLYSPAFSQAIEPLRWLGWDGFRDAWRLLNLGVLAALAGPLTGLAIFVQPIALEMNIGNIHLLLAAAIVVGFRWPQTWAFVLLTKVTPGIGLLWFAVRREWRKLWLALGTTLVVWSLSYMLDPGAWHAWFVVLQGPQEPVGYGLLVTLPLLPRLVLAGLLVTWGALTDRRWTVLAAAFLALPAVWLAALTMFISAWALALRRPS